jgi:hypothetical protein
MIHEGTVESFILFSVPDGASIFQENQTPAFFMAGVAHRLKPLPGQLR